MSAVRIIKAADRIPLVAEYCAERRITFRVTGGTVIDVLSEMKYQRRTGQLVIHLNDGGVQAIEFIAVIRE